MLNKIIKKMEAFRHSIQHHFGGSQTDTPKARTEPLDIVWADVLKMSLKEYILHHLRRKKQLTSRQITGLLIVEIEKYYNVILREEDQKILLSKVRSSYSSVKSRTKKSKHTKR